MTEMTECPATVKIHDEKWGLFINHCDLNAGHPGDHRTAYTACYPVAYLSWSGSAQHDEVRDET
ncbi:MAG: hypothetical protein LC798_19720 [Chloroflexi bacterium]|nr:hypothetical protein [Chloroflexota bacterium]